MRKLHAPHLTIRFWCRTDNDTKEAARLPCGRIVTLTHIDRPISTSIAMKDGRTRRAQYSRASCIPQPC